ncbi:MAG: hypothetical protein HY956_07810, partial [Deltaproteobacteria bacterium]|nr:hypothetical protein [Deltaproteobacteria bacterium]
MEFLANIDREIFLLVNHGFTSGALDSVMTYVTEKFNFLGAIIVAAILILVLGKRK